jgi:crotonobetaine/carnitine-CoA ligase
MTPANGHTEPDASSVAEGPGTLLEAVTDRLADEYPTRFGFDETWTQLGDLDDMSDRCARALRELGIGEGDRVATMLPNRVEFLALWLATMKLGAILVSVNTALRGDWLHHVLGDADPKLVVVDPEFAGRVDEVVITLPMPRRVLIAGSPEADALFVGDPIEDRFEPNPSTPTLIIYTSGTTGRSKGCLVSHGYLLNYARLRDASLPRLERETAFTALPLFHLAAIGLAVTTLVKGGGAYFMRRFSVSSFWPEIELSGASYVALMGGAVPMLAQAPDNEASLRCRSQVRVLTGSASPAVNDVLRERFGVQQTDMHFFGQTEACPIASSSSAPYRRGTSGFSNDSFDMAIVDEHDNVLGIEEVGQIVCRPRRPNVMFSGYWRNPDATLAKSTTMWWHTGDLGYLDADGYLHFVDRGDDRIRRRGENVSSFELEKVVAGHPAVAAVAAIATPSEFGEDEVKLVVVLNDGASVTPDELSAWCEPRVPRFANPRYIEFVDSLPMTPTGKVQKNVLRAAASTDGTWDRMTSQGSGTNDEVRSARTTT